MTTASSTKRADVTCKHCKQPIEPCHRAGQLPTGVCAGWRHTALIAGRPIGAHYCRGRSINPLAEPAGNTACCPKRQSED